jgi:hypothetical protein
VLQAGVPPEQLVSLRQATQTCEVVLQYGVEPEQSLLLAQPQLLPPATHFLLFACTEQSVAQQIGVVPLTDAMQVPELHLEEPVLPVVQGPPPMPKAARASPADAAIPNAARKEARSHRRKSIGGPTCKAVADLLHRYVAGLDEGYSASFAGHAKHFGVTM